MEPSVAPTAGGLRLSLMMFLQFFVWGAWYVTTGPYMEAHGMGSVIFLAYTVGPIAAIVSPFFLGMIADRFFASERVLGVMHVLGGVALLAAPLAARLEWTWAPSDGPLSVLREGPFIGILLLHMLCYMPTLGLTNTIALHAMSRPEKQFPLIRVWGTIGWIVAGVLISKLGADRDAMQFHVAGVAGILLGIYSFSLPRTPPPAAGKAFSARDAFGLDALAMLRTPAFLIFIICSILICIPLQAYYAYAGTFVGAQGVVAVGDVMSRGQMSEILFMLIMPLCFARLGVKWMLAIGMFAWVVRYALFAGAAGGWGVGPSSRLGEWLLGDASLVLPIFFGILLHGICYDFFFVTGFIYVDRAAPKALRASAQGFLVLVTQGLGMFVGAQLSGWLFARATAGTVTDWREFWMFPAIFAAVVMLFFIATFRPKPAPAALH